MVRIVADATGRVILPVRVIYIRFFIVTIAPNKASSKSDSNKALKNDFPDSAPSANPVFYRTYSRKKGITKQRESWSEVVERNLSDLKSLGSETLLSISPLMMTNLLGYFCPHCIAITLLIQTFRVNLLPSALK